MKSPEQPLSASAEQKHRNQAEQSSARQLQANSNQPRPGESLQRLAADRLRHFANLR